LPETDPLIGDATSGPAPKWKDKYRLGVILAQDGPFVSILWSLGDATKENVKGDLPWGVPKPNTPACHTQPDIADAETGPQNGQVGLRAENRPESPRNPT